MHDSAGLATINASSEVLREAFAGSLKPHLARLLSAFALDVCYHRAEGDYLYYHGPDGEVMVLDFIGGFGASLFGHNHPELLDLARQLLAERRPFHAQASIRGYAGLLAERLAALVGRATGRSYIVTLSSTGAEAVETAIKHAELEMLRRNDSLLEKFDEDGRRLRMQLREGRAWFPQDFLDEVSIRLGVPVRTIDDLLAALRRNLEQSVERAAVFLAVAGSFHGKSTGALKLTHRLEFRLPWRRLGSPATFLPIDDIAAVEAEVERARMPYLTLAVDAKGLVSLREESLVNISGIFVEPIQGEGGIHELNPHFLQAVRHFSDTAGCPLVIDEIQTGMGRCGTFLASEASGVRGDYYLFSKSLGGGLAKISALLVDRDRYDLEFSYLHTSTLADDDFSSAIALRTLDILERDEGALMSQCREKGDRLLERLRRLQSCFPNQVREVRGRGLMLGIELEPQTASPSPLLRVLSEQHLLTYLACGYLLREHRIRVAPTLSKSSVIRLEPSAYITDDAIERLVFSLEQLCSLLQRSEVGPLVAYMADRSIAPGACATVDSRSVPRIPFDPADGATPVAFLVHFSEPVDLYAWEPRLSAFSETDCVRILDRTHGLLRPFILDHATMRSARGASVKVIFIGVPFTAEQAVESLRAGDDWPLDLVREGVELAANTGCTVVGLGGHTSIVSDNCRRIVDDRLTITSGNSLTVAAAYEACRLAARRLGLDLNAARMAVVGAAGNVGAVLAEIAADEVGQILLLGRQRAERFLLPTAYAIYVRALRRLKRGERSGISGAIAGTRTAERLLVGGISDAEQLGTMLYHGLLEELGERAPICLATSLDVLRTCQLVVSATSAPRPIILPEHIADTPTVVCDVAIPRDVDPSVTVERPNAVVIRGGRVWAPLGQILDIPAMRLTDAELYGCLAETILLGFAGPECPASYGKLSPFRVRRVRDLASLHGFGIDERIHP